MFSTSNYDGKVFLKNFKTEENLNVFYITDTVLGCNIVGNDIFICEDNTTRLFKLTKYETFGVCGKVTLAYGNYNNKLYTFFGYKDISLKNKGFDFDKIANIEFVKERSKHNEFLRSLYLVFDYFENDTKTNHKIMIADYLN